MKFTQQKVLVVSPDIPYPPNHGGRLDIWKRILLLKSFGFKVDLIATGKVEPSKEDIQVIKQSVDNFTFCLRKNRVSDMFRILPLQINSRNKLKEIELNSQYEFTILETEHVYGIMNNESLKSKHFILRIQNDEPKYFKELALSARSVFDKFYYYIESFKFLHLGRRIINLKNYMLISLDEFADFKKKYPNKNAIFLPTFSITSDFKSISLTSMNVLFVGSFFMINNKEGILWYLEKVHHLLNDIDNYKLIIAGNSRGEDISWLHKACSQYENIEIHDSPEELEPIYNQGAVFINPMLHGSGVKLKTIEAIQNCLPVVSTTVGNQGTGLVPDVDILVANEPVLYASSIRKLLNDKEYAGQIVASGQNRLFTHFNQATILREYLESLLKD